MARATTTKPTPPKPATARVVTDEDVRRRAYEIFLARGNAPGTPEEDWTRAERELRGATTLAR